MPALHLTLRHGSLVLPWLLVGCAMHQAARMDVAGASKRASGGAASVPMQHYALPIGDVSSGGNLIQSTLPRYPPAEIPACPARVVVVAAVRVDRAGRVVDVIGNGMDAAAATASWQRYFAAVRGAARHWRFNPLQVTHWAGDAAGNSHAVDSAAESFQRRYVFDFTCHAGKPRVRMEAADAG